MLCLGGVGINGLVVDLYFDCWLVESVQFGCESWFFGYC